MKMTREWWLTYLTKYGTAFEGLAGIIENEFRLENEEVLKFN